MNGEGPSVPITTLAGIQSLTDLLYELPLAGPLPGTTGGQRSLLSHGAHDAEEAQRLLAGPDTFLVPQLLDALNRTSLDQVEVKDGYCGRNAHCGQTSQLLQFLLNRNPGVFGGLIPVQTPQPSPSAANANVSQAQVASTSNPTTQPGQPATPGSSPWMQTQFSPNAIYSQPASSSSFSASHLSSCSPHSNSPQFPTQESPSYFDQCGPQSVGGNAPNANQTVSMGNPPTPSASVNPSLTPNHGSIPQPSSNQLSSYSFAQVTGQPSSITLPHTPTVLVSPNSLPNNCSPQTPSSIVADDKTQYASALKHEEQLLQTNSQNELPLVNSISNGDCSKGSVKTFSSDESRTEASFMPIQAEVPNCTDNFNKNHHVPATFTEDQPLSKNGGSNCEAVKSRNTTLDEPSHRKVVNSVTNSDSTELNNNFNVSDNLSGVPAKRDRRQSSANEPVVILKKLSYEEQILAQKSIKQFNKKVVHKPENENEIVIEAQEEPPVKKPKTPVKNCETSIKKKSSSSSSSVKKETNYRVFTSKRKEPDKNKMKSSKRNHNPDFLDDSNSLADKVKKRRRSNQASYVESPLSGEDGGSGNESSEGSLDKIFSPTIITNQTPIVNAVKKVKKKIKKEIVENLEDISESNTFQNFSRIVDSIFEAMEEIDLTVELDENAGCPEEILINLSTLKELSGEAAKMRMLKVTNQFSTNKLNKLLIILERNIMDGSKIYSEMNADDQDEDEGRMFMELVVDRIIRSVEASLICLYIMTSASMPEKVFVEDTIERIVTLAKFQLQNSVYPIFDPAYRIDPKAKDGYSGSIKQKRAHASKTRHRSIIQLYNKLHEIVGLLGELLDVQTMTDTIILKMSTLGVSPFFVEGVSELQLSALRLVTSIFAGYPKHRQLILEDILASIARLPTSKRSLRNYRLNSEENIQMLTALVLQLIHSVVQLPDIVEKPKPMNILGAIGEKKSHKGSGEKNDKKVESAPTTDREILITTSYQAAIKTGYSFLTVFLRKCGTKNEDMDYRPLFENFVQDLLSTLNKPEWPATEPLLNLLGGLLVQNFSNKSVDTPIRVASLEYLGVVASRLRKDAVSSQLRKESIEEVIQQIVKENLDEDDVPLSSLSPKGKKSKHKASTSSKTRKKDDTQILQKALLNYIDDNMESDPTLLFARRFYIAQWYKDTTAEIAATRNKGSRAKEFAACSSPPSVSSTSKSKNKHGANRHKRNATVNTSYTESNDEAEEVKDEPDDEEDKTAQLYALVEERKDFLFTLIAPKNEKSKMKKSGANELDYETAELVARFLSSKRSISKSFDFYLLKILLVLNETTVAVRTKAMKSLSMVVEADPSILSRPEMQKGVSRSLLDPSTSVREAVIDLVGKFILIRPELTHQYYDMLTARILDTGVSVRKRVIKILKEVCLEQPDFPKIPEICVKIIRRVNDEEGIKKLVGEVFQSMWFVPVSEREKERIIQKVKNITHVVAACKDIGLEWFEQLLSNLLKAKEELNVKPVVKACKQIVDCLVENVLTLEESASEVAASENLAACFTTLSLFTKIQPHLVIPHATTIQPYLSIGSNTQYDYIVAQNAANILQKIVPLLDHPSEYFLSQLEESLVKLVLTNNLSQLLNSCVACLGAIVNSVTKNYGFVLEVFRKFFVCVLGCRKLLNENRLQPKHRANLLRSLNTLGLFCVQFDFNLPALDPDKRHGPARIFEVLHFFTLHNDNEISLKALCGLGLFLQRYYDFMMGPEVKELYQAILTNPNALPAMKCQVLRNMSNYLAAEDARLNLKDAEWNKVGKNEDLKEMDASSGMASTVIQIYLKQVLEAVVSKQELVRQAALKVIQVTLGQGLVHPVQIVPYLICLGSDDDNVTRAKADQLLQDIEKKYPGFVQMKALVGVQMSYKLQQLLKPRFDSLVRGFRMADCPISRNGFLYSVIRGTRQNRRAFVLSILKRFDEQCRTSVAEMIYLADNLVYFPFQAQDEPLFIMHHIDVMLSVTGANLLQSFREGLIQKNKNTKNTDVKNKPDEQSGICENGLPDEKHSSEGPEPPPTDTTVPDTKPVAQSAVTVDEEDDDDDDFDAILERLPDNTKSLEDCIKLSQGCVLLLFVKQTLKDMYGFTDSKIQQYSPNEAAKIYEKALNRRSGVTFKPNAVLDFAQQTLKREESDILDAEGRKALVNHYLNFKQLMLSIDPSDDDEDDEGGGTSNSARNNAATADQLLRTYTGVATAINASRTGGVKDEGDDETNNSNKTVNSAVGAIATPLRDIVVSNKTAKTPATNRSRSKHKTPKTSSSHKEKIKKKHKKKRRRILETDSEDNSDPDYE